MKVFKIFLYYIALAALMAGCSNVEPQDTTIDISVVLRTNNIIHNIIAQKLNERADFSKADIALISYLYTKDINNISVPEPQITASALAAAKYKEKVGYFILNGDSLYSSSPLIFPGFFTSFSWSIDKHNYNMLNNWEFVYGGKSMQLETKNQSPVFRLKLEGDDTIRPNKQILLTWHKTENNDSAENKVYIYFKWYPSYGEVNSAKDFAGFDAEDTGIMAMGYDQLQKKGIPLYGVLQICLIRYNVFNSVQNNLKIITSNVVESSVSANIKK